MKLVFDTCVLYPTVMRETLMGACAVMGWTPLWSDRILEEWARAARKLGPNGEPQARAEIALLSARWPNAKVTWAPSLETKLYLPDKDDRHVLAAAIAGSADKIVTVNVKDFPKASLWDEGVDRIDPDALVMEAWLQHSDAMQEVGLSIVAQASQLSGEKWSARALFKKARLPRFAKAVSAALP